MESSQSAITKRFEDLRTKGQSVLDDLDAARQDTLFRFELGLSALNSRRQRAARVLSPDVACQFIASDLIDVDQAGTSATLRPDSGGVLVNENSYTKPESSGAVPQVSAKPRQHRSNPGNLMRKERASLHVEIFWAGFGKRHLWSAQVSDPTRGRQDEG